MTTSTISSDASLPQLRRFDWRGLVLPAGFLLVWALVTALGWVNTKLIPPPQAVLSTAVSFIGKAQFFNGLGASLWRDLAGFAIGSLAGVVFGALLGVSRWAGRIVGPTFHTLKHIALFAWLPLISTWLGQGDAAKVLFIGLSAFYPVALGALEGVHGIARSQLEVARVYGFGRVQLLFKLILPGASPQILAGLHLALIYAWLATIGAEYLLAKSGPGIGDAVIQGKAAFDVPLVIFGMLLIGLVGALFNQIANRIEARLLRWRDARH
ncbi:sulfonate transport system permease protein [Andreprevotia lacus DSM 23236]|jgi:sulfonate transport system permease protein|uniref:Sulfonate transport system permease protein n=1 Tax=Andreprevotia lacus DSM 23236 TaxID=1121001 RepID=A0A1W1Y175_9NEIS|nr:ABC transporter permease [Andreprevotia lacus]SMC29939.1 sulfonate transport system permease protein [Andreprevotia lacus DSM 23236]